MNLMLTMLLEACGMARAGRLSFRDWLPRDILGSSTMAGGDFRLFRFALARALRSAKFMACALTFLSIVVGSIFSVRRTLMMRDDACRNGFAERSLVV